MLAVCVRARFGLHHNRDSLSDSLSISRTAARLAAVTKQQQQQECVALGGKRVSTGNRTLCVQVFRFVVQMRLNDGYITRTTL